MQSERICKVSEIGHGASSLFFALFISLDKSKNYGIDDNNIDNTVSVHGLNTLCASYPTVTFYSGYLGGKACNDLPSDF